MRPAASWIAAWLAAVSLVVATGAMAASEGGYVEHSGVNSRDVAAVQRGAKLFVNYCLSCHSAAYMRYNRLAEDLDLSEDLVMQNLVFSDAKIGDTMDIAMRPADAQRWFGKTPPDLSLAARSRGVDWLYSYMKGFYRDESGGWNNLLLPNAAMPHVLWQLQGTQEPVYHTVHGEDVIEKLVLIEPGIQTPEEYEYTVRDLVTFLDYLSEPSKLKRKSVGIWVMLFLAFFAFLTYLLKAEYWRDVH
jgi:ubiquinol-cytochrome c reductase cytochrome c1 subunit